MSKKRVVSWGLLHRVCKRKGIEVRQRGSEVLLLLLTDGRRICHVLSHKCCKNASAIVWPDHLAAVKRKFGISNADLSR
jgi:hypothetical protein